MVTREQLYTVEEFREYARLPENEHRRLELEDGEIVDMGSSRPINTIVAARIIHFLNAHVIPNDLGHVTGADGGFKLGKYTSRPIQSLSKRKSSRKFLKHLTLLPI